MAAILLVAPLTTGCMAGRGAETTKEATTIDGSSASVGHLRLRNIYAPGPASGAAYPAGADIPIYLSVVSLAASDGTDQLVSASSPMGTVTVLPGSSSSTGSSSPGSSSAGPAGTPLPAPSLAAPSGAPVPIPAGRSVDFAPGGPSLLLSGTTKPVAAASFVPVTLTFAQAGTVQVQVAVDNGYSSAAPGAGITGSGTPGLGATATATPSPLASAS